MSELVPCPFCGRTDGLSLKRICIEPDFCTVAVICTKCSSSGSKEYTAEKAVERWNTRHYPPEVEKAVERMKPMKGVIRTDNFLEAECCYCPSCDTYLEPPYEVSDFCPECGQALDWEVL